MSPTIRSWETDDSILITVARGNGQAWDITVNCLVSGCGENLRVSDEYWETHSESQVEQEMIERVRSAQAVWRRQKQIEGLLLP